jgi:RNA polymerase sigma factor (sigma-70 family)
MVSAGSAVATDEQLVAAAREGSDEAFAILFRRYRDRIGTQVRGMVHDHARTEDIVQDAFVSALRSLRATDQDIAFKPWIQQIARNACIDHLRRVKRTEEVSIDAGELLPDVERRLSASTPPIDVAVFQKQEIDDLQQAFGGLPASQHEILVLRELEGLSYREIGRRMRLTPAAVESMLSRARRSLKGQFDEIETGERCRRMRPVMAAVSRGLSGKRDRRSLERHLRYCRRCRHEALALGLDDFVAASERGGVRGALARVAALFPLPWLLRRRGGSGDAGAAGGASTAAHGPLTHLSAMGGAGVEQTASVLHKAAALVVVAAVAGGGTLVANKTGVDLPGPKLAPGGGSEASAAHGGPASGSADGSGAGNGATGAIPAGLGAAPGSPATVGGRGGETVAGDSPGAVPGAPGTAPGGGKAPALPGAGGGEPPGTLPLPGLPAVEVKLPSSRSGGSEKTADDGGKKTSGDDGKSSPSFGGYVPPPGIQKKIERGDPIPPGIQKKIDEALGGATLPVERPPVPKIKEKKLTDSPPPVLGPAG